MTSKLGSISRFKSTDLPYYWCRLEVLYFVSIAIKEKSMGKVYKRTMALAAFVLMLFLGSVDANATHALGGDLAYTCVSVDPVTGEAIYDVQIQFYRDCGGIPARTSLLLSYQSVGCSGGGSINVPLSLTCMSAAGYVTNDQLPLICDADVSNSTCNGGFLPGVEVYNYCTQITLPGNCDKWILSFKDDNRNAVISNLANPDTWEIWVQDTLNKALGPDGVPICNNSATFTNPPAQYFCAGICYNYNHGAVDIDGDSLGFKLVNPLGNNGATIPLVPPATVAVPIPNSNFTFDERTGEISFCPTTVTAYVVAVLVEEWRTIAGVKTLVGSTVRDMQFTIGPPFFCSAGNPTTPSVDTVTAGAQADTTTFAVCLGDTLNATITSTDLNGLNITLSSNDVGFIDGTVFNVTNNGSTSTATLFWAPDSNDLGFHFFTVSSVSQGCPIPGFAQETFIIEVFENVRAFADANIYCVDSVQLSAIGTPPFSWSPIAGLSDPNSPNPKAAPAVPTWYIVQDRCGTDSVFIDVFQSNVSQIADNCNSSASQLIAAPISGSGWYNFTWRDSNNTIVQNTLGAATDTLSNPNVGAYYLEVTDTAGCTQFDTLIVTAGSSIGVALQTTDAGCFGDSSGSIMATNIGGSPPITYLWSTGAGANTLTNIPAGTYTITITDANGCTASDSAVVNESLSIPYTINSVPTTCNGDTDGEATVTVDTSSGISPSIVWSNGQTTYTATNLTAGTYSFTLTDNASGCTLTDAISVPEPDGFSVSINEVMGTSCNGNDGSALASVGGDTTSYSFLWSDNQTTATATGLSQGLAIVTATDSLGCSNSASVTIDELSPFELEINTTPTCAGESNGTASANIVSGGAAPYTYQWSSADNASLSTDSSINGLLAGVEYTLTVTDFNGCTEVASASIVETANNLFISAEPETGITSGETVTLSAEGDVADSYQWFPESLVSNSTEAIVTSQPNDTTLFIVSGTFNGCVQSDSIWVFVINPGAYAIPTAFTPNGDGMNDKFGVIIFGDVDVIELKVFNRWGEKIYSTEDGEITNGWNGIYKGTPQPVGTYVWCAKVNNLVTGEVKVEAGTLSLIR